MSYILGSVDRRPDKQDTLYPSSADSHHNVARYNMQSLKDEMDKKYMLIEAVL